MSEQRPRGERWKREIFAGLYGQKSEKKVRIMEIFPAYLWAEKWENNRDNWYPRKPLPLKTQIMLLDEAETWG